MKEFVFSVKVILFSENKFYFISSFAALFPCVVRTFYGFIFSKVAFGFPSPGEGRGAKK
jgi:hypothetical protein